MSRNDRSDKKSQLPLHLNERSPTLGQNNTLQQDDQCSRSDESNPPKVKLLENYNYKHIDGVNYLSLIETTDVSEVFPLLPDFNLRDDDVFLAGFPKSGNHWIFEILHMILQQDAAFTEILITDSFLEVRGVDVQRKLDEMAAPRVLGTHLRSRRFPKQIVEKQVKIVYPLRNPKDVAVSMYGMVSSILLEGMIYTATFSEFFEQFIRGEFVWGDWFDHTLSMEKFMKDHPEHPVFVACYERMKTSPVEVIKELCAFLNKPDAIAEEIAKTTEMSNMKKVLMSGKEGRYQQGKMKPDAVFRKGIIGDWKQWLTVSQSEAVDKLFQEKMSNSQLARLVEEYI